MHMSDTIDINATPDVVYKALLDPEVLLDCIPGASEVTGNATDGYEATVTQKVGPVKATFKGKVTMPDMVQNKRLTIAGEGKGGAAGHAKGGADVTFEATEDGGTWLHYDVDVKIGGKLAQLGSRIIDSFAKKLADQFFTNLREGLEGPNDEGDAAKETPKKGWFKRITVGA
ncbi:MAG: carbon monoxide dehydrogenase subunit G [Rhodobacteraceae bacterium]|nr:carbon monoxide dehydrogenase subunit G [Paracoccaceae bacterium]